METRFSAGTLRSRNTSPSERQAAIEQLDTKIRFNTPTHPCVDGRCLRQLLGVAWMCQQCLVASRGVRADRNVQTSSSKSPQTLPCEGESWTKGLVHCLRLTAACALPQRLRNLSGNGG